MEKTREFLRSIGLPGGDAYNLPTSEKDFQMGLNIGLKCQVFKVLK